MEETKPTTTTEIYKNNIFFGVVYKLVAAGFYVAILMLSLSGLVSLSTTIALQEILLKEFGWAFLVVSLLLSFMTILIYLRRPHGEKLALTAIKPHRVFISSLVIILLITYTILATLVLFTFMGNYVKP